MRKLDILWSKHTEIKYPQQNKSTKGSKANKRGHGSNERLSIDEIPFL